MSYRFITDFEESSGFAKDFTEDDKFSDAVAGNPLSIYKLIRRSAKVTPLLLKKVNLGTTNNYSRQNTLTNIFKSCQR